jgi:hypothetical protein
MNLCQAQPKYEQRMLKTLLKPLNSHSESTKLVGSAFTMIPSKSTYKRFFARFSRIGNPDKTGFLRGVTAQGHKLGLPFVAFFFVQPEKLTPVRCNGG